VLLMWRYASMSDHRMCTSCTNLLMRCLAALGG
jgi:hypothetical protein